jgi:hypothetical protein
MAQVIPSILKVAFSNFSGLIVDFDSATVFSPGALAVCLQLINNTAEIDATNRSFVKVMIRILIGTMLY